MELNFDETGHRILHGITCDILISRVFQFLQALGLTNQVKNDFFLFQNDASN